MKRLISSIAVRQWDNFRC